MSIEYRPGVEEDDPVTYDVFARATGELNRRRGLPDRIADQPPPRFLAFRRYARAHHGDAYWVAHDGHRTVGFGIGIRHPGVWYLAALHVLPEYQGRGIGRRLLDLTLGTAERSDAVCAISAGMQPSANAIYVRAGMLPWTPVFEWETAPGGIVPEIMVAADADVQPTDDLGVVADFDRRVMGIDRAGQLSFWLEQPDVECLVLSVDGVPAGYAFVSDEGGVGPAAVLDESDAGPLLSAAVGRLRQRGIGQVSLKLAGLSPGAYDVVRHLGLRIAGTALIVVSSRPLWTTGCYVPSAGDALY